MGPELPLIITRGGSRTLTCTHNIISTSALDWYREASAIRDDLPDVDEVCSCQVSTNNNTLTFSNFAPGSIGQYSCRAPRGLAVFDICKFNVLLAGE